MSIGKILVVASQKGGVGKTTLALNGAYALAQRGLRTLLVDADPQGSIAYSVQGDLHKRPGLKEVLEGSRSLEDSVVVTRLRELALLPVGELPPTESFRWSASLEDGERLGALFDRVRQSYDVVLVDTPPALGGVTLGALRRADHVIMPLQAEPLAARSVRHLLDVLGSLREEGAAVEIAGLVVTMLQSRQDPSLAVAQESWKLFPANLVFETSIPRDGAFLHASAAGTPVALLHRRPPAVAAVFDQLAAELEAKIGLASDDSEAIPLLG
jgi:chromosome partitioning protein